MQLSMVKGMYLHKMIILMMPMVTKTMMKILKMKMKSITLRQMITILIMMVKDQMMTMMMKKMKKMTLKMITMMIRMSQNQKIQRETSFKVSRNMITEQMRRRKKKRLEFCKVQKFLKMIWTFSCTNALQPCHRSCHRNSSGFQMNLITIQTSL